MRTLPNVEAYYMTLRVAIDRTYAAVAHADELDQGQSDTIGSPLWTAVKDAIEQARKGLALANNVPTPIAARIGARQGFCIVSGHCGRAERDHAEWEGALWVLSTMRLTDDLRQAGILLFHSTKKTPSWQARDAGQFYRNVGDVVKEVDAT